MDGWMDGWMDGSMDRLGIDWDSAFEPCFSDIGAMWNVFEDRIISRTRKFVPLIRFLIVQPIQNGVNHYQSILEILLGKKAKNGKNITEQNVYLVQINLNKLEMKPVMLLALD